MTNYDIKAVAVAMEPDLAENAGLPIHPAEAAPVQISYATKDTRHVISDGWKLQLEANCTIWVFSYTSDIMLRIGGH